MKSNIFGTCANCGAISHHGICCRCGWTVVCCRCGKVKLPNGSWEMVAGDIGQISHGMCQECKSIILAEFKEDLKCKQL